MEGLKHRKFTVRAGYVFFLLDLKLDRISRLRSRLREPSVNLESKPFYQSAKLIRVRVGVQDPNLSWEQGPVCREKRTNGCKHSFWNVRFESPLLVFGRTGGERRRFISAIQNFEVRLEGKTRGVKGHVRVRLSGPRRAHLWAG